MPFGASWNVAISPRKRSTRARYVWQMMDMIDDPHPDIHHLKISSKYFDAVKDGRKTFEIRKNDRNYRNGNVLILRECDDGEYTGRIVVVYVAYVLTHEDFPDGIQPGYCIMSIKRATE